MENDENKKEIAPVNASPNQGDSNRSNTNDNTMTIAVVSLVFGLLSCAGNAAWGWGSMPCLILAIVGMLMAINANKKKTTTPGVLGLITSLIGLLISGAGTACFVCASVGAGAIVSATACGIVNCIH